jgi:predicted SprT family Zn-dependent metalloprotease
MALHEGEKYRCQDCNAQIVVIRSSDTRSLDFEAPRANATAAVESNRNSENQFQLNCCGNAMVRYCMKAA